MPKIPCAPTDRSRMMRRELLTYLIEEREMFLCDALRILGARDRAEDAVQDAALRCLESAAITDEIGNPRGLVRSIVRNIARDRLRRDTREASAPLIPGDDLPSDQPGPEQHVDGRQDLARLARGLSHLPPAHRDILLKHRLQARRQKDIAQEAGLSPVRINRILAQSQSRLKEFLADPAWQEPQEDVARETAPVRAWRGPDSMSGPVGETR